MTRLRQLRDHGCLDRAHIVAAADGVGVSDATVYRWVRRAERAPDPTRGRFTLSSTDVAALEDFHGRVAAVYRARSAALAGRRRAAGVPIDPRLWRDWQGQRAVSRACFYRAVARQWDPAERAYWRCGEEARRARRVWPQRSSPHRNAIWQADHTQLEIVVVPGRGRPLRPWLTTFVDTYSRMIMGWAISERGDAGTVLCALRSALLIDPLHGPHGGVPAVIECDHGADFVSQAIERVASNLVIHVRPVMPHDGRGKGKIERWHQTVEQMLLVQLPGYTGGPRDKRGRLYGPVRDDGAWLDAVAASDRAAVAGTEDEPGAAMLTLPQLGRLFTEWARFFNHEHHHEGLRGRTPLQVWNGDPTQIDVLDAAQLRDLLLVTDGAAITSRGIRHRNLHYVASEIQGMVGERVTIRYTPHDDRFLEVYTSDGRHLGTATPADAQTPEQAEDYRRSWREESKQLAARRRKATARARGRIEPLTAQHVTGDQALPADTSAGSERAAPVAQTRLVARAAPLPAQGPVVRAAPTLLGLTPTRVVSPASTVSTAAQRRTRRVLRTVPTAADGRGDA